jgi:hypothetical protein
MTNILKWLILIFITFLAEHFITIDGIHLNFSFILVYLFVIDYMFPEEEQKKVYPSEVLPILFFSAIGFIEDLFQGIIGPAIISKTISGIGLMILAKQIFFNWTEIFKSLVIFCFTIIDEGLHTFIISYFLNIDTTPLKIFKTSVLQGLMNIPAALLLSWRKP